MNKSTAKNVLIVTAGVMVAGFLMNQLRGQGVVDQVRQGFS